jgi:sensor histidine kinase regulating citrate/malate metabolism
MINKIVLFYVDGFKNLSSLGKKLWLIIIIKLVVIFVVLKVFFFPTVDNVVKDQNQKEALFIKQLTTIPSTQNLQKEK